MNEEKETTSEQYEKMAGRIKQWRRENPKATLTEIEEAVDKELNQLRRVMVEGVIGESEAVEKVTMRCPNCGVGMRGNGKKKRELQSKGGERIELERAQMRCPACGMTVFPPG